MKADLVQRLRDRAYAFKASDPLVEEAADEIERLRALADKRGEIAVNRRREIERLRLTDAEREALHHVVGDVADITGPVEETLRALLERTK